MSKSIAYNGSHAAVDVPQAGLYGVKRGEPVEVESAEVRERLRQQGWTDAHGATEPDMNPDENTDNEEEGDDE